MDNPKIIKTKDHLKMPEQPEGEHLKQERWRADCRAFVSAMCRHWLWWLSWTIGSGLAALCAAWLESMPGGGKVIPLWVYETAVATGLIVASFRAFRDQRQIAEQANDETSLIERTLTELAERNESAQKNQISLLEIQVQKLQAQLDDKITRKEIKDSLAAFRKMVQSLTSQLRDITYYHFEGEIRLKFDQDYLNFKNKTHVFLTEKVGRSEAITFDDTEKVPIVVAPSESQFDMPEWYDRWVAKEWRLNRLKYDGEQLKKIEDKLDSKNFILPLGKDPLVHDVNT